MNGREKCSLSGTVKFTRVTSNLKNNPNEIIESIIYQVVPVDSDGDGGEDPSQPGARQWPGEEVEGTEVEALQGEHRVGVEHDWTKAEVVGIVECCQHHLLVDIEPG